MMIELRHSHDHRGIARLEQRFRLAQQQAMIQVDVIAAAATAATIIVVIVVDVVAAGGCLLVAAAAAASIALIAARIGGFIVESLIGRRIAIDSIH